MDWRLAPRAGSVVLAIAVNAASAMSGGAQPTAAERSAPANACLQSGVAEAAALEAQLKPAGRELAARAAALIYACPGPVTPAV